MLEQHDLGPRSEAEPGRHPPVRLLLAKIEHAAGRLAIVAADPFREARARADDVIEHVLGDEGAAPLLDADEALARQFLERAAHGVAIDAEAGREQGLGGQPAAGRTGAAEDLALEGLGDLAPESDARVREQRGGGARARPRRTRCHRKFVHLRARLAIFGVDRHGDLI